MAAGCLLWAVVMAAVSAEAQTTLRVMSFNIRLDVESDGENRWDARKEKVAALMAYYEPDFIGAQEVQHHQLQYLLATLSQYRSIGVGRDDGKTGGEYSCILYNHHRVEPVRQSTFWLSASPDSVSRGWDAACHRVCTYGLFRIKATGQLCWVFNTHFDHVGEVARASSARLIIERIQTLNRVYSYPVVLTGDFNAHPSDEPVKYIASHMINSRSVSLQPAYGPSDTWNAFRFDQQPTGCIDYIFISPAAKWKVQKFSTITDSYDRKYPSDHFPVMATLELISPKSKK